MSKNLLDRLGNGDSPYTNAYRAYCRVVDGERERVTIEANRYASQRSRGVPASVALANVRRPAPRITSSCSCDACEHRPTHDPEH